MWSLSDKLNRLCLLTANFENPYGDSTKQINVRFYIKALTFISEAASTILGVAVFLVLMILPIITALDMLYILSPNGRNHILKKGLDGRDGSRRFKLISKDAVEAVDEAEVEGKSCVKIYLKKRIGMYIVAGVLSMVLLLGVDFLVPIIRELLSGVIYRLESEIMH